MSLAAGDARLDGMPLIARSSVRACVRACTRTDTGDGDGPTRQQRDRERERKRERRRKRETDEQRGGMASARQALIEYKGD